jgi:hypothetical protein
MRASTSFLGSLDTGGRIALVDALRVQALVLLRQEQLPNAEQALLEGLHLARSMPYPYGEARLLQVYGQLLAQGSDLEPARDCLEAALTIFRRLGARNDVERAEQLLATLG